MLVLSELVNPGELSLLNQAGLMSVRSDINQAVNLVMRTKRAADLNQWNPLTMGGPIVTTLGGQVLARGFNHVLTQGDERFPESLRQNWPAEFEITELLDGWTGLLGVSRSNSPVIVSEYGVNFEPARWASQFYFDNYRHISWPVGYSPVFEILHQGYQKVVVPAGNYIYLLALVNLKTGAEFPRPALEAVAKYNKIPLVRAFGSEQEAQKAAPRGYVATFHIDDTPSVRVKVEDPEYLAIRALIADATPSKIAESLKAGSNFYQKINMDRELPIKFRTWVFKQRKELMDIYINRCQRVLELLEKCPFKMVPDNSKHVEEYLENYGANVKDAALAHWRRDTEWTALIWDSVLKDVKYKTAYLEWGV